MKLLMLLVFFLLLGGFYIISEENIRLNSFENVDDFFVLYAKWADKIIENGRTVSGYIVKMEWLPGEGVVG